MIRWCAHCQKYLGEKAPLDDYAITHSVCPDCAEKYLAEDGHVSPRLREITDFYNDLLDVGRRGDPVSVPGVINKASDLGIRPHDLLVGILQPALYAIGKAWECGEIMAETEHRFTAIVQSIIEHLDLSPDGSERLRNSNSPDVLVVAAEGNQHFLGIIMLEAFLQMHGVRSRIVFPGIPVQETLLLASRLRPRVLGISLALPEQESTLASVNAWLESGPEFRPACIAGGYWARQRTEVNSIGHIRVASDPEEILRALDARSDRSSPESR